MTRLEEKYKYVELLSSYISKNLQLFVCCVVGNAYRLPAAIIETRYVGVSMREVQ